MKDRDLIGERVISQNYGEGEIINVFPEKVEIKFVSKTSQFIWKAFTMSLKAVRPEIQKYLEEKSMLLITFSIGEYGIGPVPKDIYISAGEILKLPKAPEGQVDYCFRGWSDGNNTYPPGSEYIAKTNTTFFAIWKKISLIHLLMLLLPEFILFFRVLPMKTNCQKDLFLHLILVLIDGSIIGNV